MGEGRYDEVGRRKGKEIREAEGDLKRVSSETASDADGMYKATGGVEGTGKGRTTLWGLEAAVVRRGRT